MESGRSEEKLDVGGGFGLGENEAKIEEESKNFKNQGNSEILVEVEVSSSGAQTPKKVGFVRNEGEDERKSEKFGGWGGGEGGRRIRWKF